MITTTIQRTTFAIEIFVQNIFNILYLGQKKDKIKKIIPELVKLPFKQFELGQRKTHLFLELRQHETQNRDILIPLRQSTFSTDKVCLQIYAYIV